MSSEVHLGEAAFGLTALDEHLCAKRKELERLHKICPVDEWVGLLGHYYVTVSKTMMITPQGELWRRIQHVEENFP